VAKILFDAPARKIQVGNMDEIFQVLDLTIRNKNQRMIRQTVNDNDRQIHVAGREPAGDLVQAGDVETAMPTDL